jgi:FKBP-type peptidyl-prolyl cis-trans isomerase FkpA
VFDSVIKSVICKKIKKMKILLPGLLLSIVLFSCLKNENKNPTCSYVDSQTIAPDSQVQRVKAYLDLNNITAQLHPSGLYYKIISPGSGTFVSNLCSVVNASYKGKLTNGITFDSTAAGMSASFQLGRVIAGWQKGIPLIAKGGSITLFIPPALGYGSQVVGDGNGNVIIPANSILIFDVKVLDISGG